MANFAVMVAEYLGFCADAIKFYILKTKRKLFVCYERALIAQSYQSLRFAGSTNYMPHNKNARLGLLGCHPMQPAALHVVAIDVQTMAEGDHHPATRGGRVVYDSRRPRLVK
jgi:hypothetical protein